MKRVSHNEIVNQVSRKYCVANILAGYRIKKDDDIEKIRPVMLKHRQTIFKIYDGDNEHVTVYVIANPSGLDFQFIVSSHISPVVEENGNRRYWDVWFMRDSKGSHKIQQSFPQFSDFIQGRIEDIYCMALEIYDHKIENYVNIDTRSKESMVCAFLEHFYNASDDADCSFKLFKSMVRFQKKDNGIWFTFPDGYSCRLEYANIISYYTKKLGLRATHRYTLYSQLTVFMEAITEWLEANTSFVSSSELPTDFKKKYARAIKEYHKHEEARKEKKRKEQEELEKALRRKKQEEAWARQREENTKNRISPYNIDAIEKARQEKGNVIWTGKEWRKSIIDL